MDIRLIAAGTSPEQRTLGARAARQVFENSGLSPLDAQSAHFKVEDAELHPGYYRTPSPDLRSAARVWHEAVSAAVEACYGAPAGGDSVRLVVER